MKPFWIELVNTGVANRYDFGDEELIEFNWRLTKYPKLYREIFLHEIGHESGNFKPKDFWHDMKSRTPGLFKFMSNHITAWTQVLPLYWSSRRKALIYDISSIISWLMIIGTGVGIYYFLNWLF